MSIAPGLISYLYIQWPMCDTCRFNLVSISRTNTQTGDVKNVDA